MRISELIAKLQEAMAEHGDLRVEIPTDYQIGDGYPIEVESIDVRHRGDRVPTSVVILG